MFGLAYCTRAEAFYGLMMGGGTIDRLPAIYVFAISMYTYIFGFKINSYEIIETNYLILPYIFMRRI